MMEIKKVDARSLLKFGFFFYLAAMLTIGVVGLAVLLYGLVTNFSSSTLVGSLGAVAVYVGMSLFYALLAALFLAASAFLYNKVAGKWGGVKVEVEAEK